MKTIKSTLIALVIAFGSSIMLSGCFVDDEEIFGQVESSNNDQSNQETNEEWTD